MRLFPLVLWRVSSIIANVPQLDFKGKTLIWNHHLSVPYHALEEKKELDFQADKGVGNLIVEGDNLLALKALLPRYGGKVKCIYIDPPYNTGNESWVYNDKVNSGLIKTWLGKSVGTDDLTRHDKWLCMMTPRLKLLRDLLSDDGVIFISIDDNEVHHLRCLMDEIFGEENFVAAITVKSNPRGRQSDSNIASIHDSLVIYSRQKSHCKLSGLPLDERTRATYNQIDEYGLKWRELGLRQRGAASLREDRPEMWFPIFVNEKSGHIRLTQDSKHNVKVTPKKSDGRESRWMWGKEKVQNECDRVFGRKVSGREDYDIFIKDFLENEGIEKTTKAKTVWDQKGVNNEVGGRTVKSLISSKFSYPKPVVLVKRILQIATAPDSIILDSFAGSGTTMHAVMELNKEDGGNRQCVLVQMREESENEPEKNIATDITRERVKRAIEKEGYESGFSYLKVGRSIDPDDLLEGELPSYQELAGYVYYLATGRQLLAAGGFDEERHFIGENGGTALFLLYVPDADKLAATALTMKMAKQMVADSQGKRRLVFAPGCYIEQEDLEEMGIEFASLPYQLFENREE